MVKPRKMLTNINAPYILSLTELMKTQSKVTLARWAIDYAEDALLKLWNKYDDGDLRPKQAIDAARMWLQGTIKLPEAKQAILACHSAAREKQDNLVQMIAARAIGQAASTIHSARHALGLPLYGSLALAYESLGEHAAPDAIEGFVQAECNRMLGALRLVSTSAEPSPARNRWRH